MNWQEKQVEVLAQLQQEQPEERIWLEKNADLEAPDLALLDTATLRERFHQKPDGIDDTRLIRTFIWQARLKIMVGAMKPVRGNIRSFWYQQLEPFYLRHDLVKTDLAPRVELTAQEAWVSRVMQRKSSSGRADRLVETMTEGFGSFVGHHVFRYQDEFRFQPPMDGKAKRGQARPGTLLFVEKDGLWWLCLLFYQGYQEGDAPDDAYRRRRQKTDGKAHPKPLPSISVMASNGQPSFLALEYFAEELKKKKVKTLTVGVVGDFDPWGLGIARSLDEKLRFLGFKVTTYCLTTPDLFSAQQIAQGRDFSQATGGLKTLVDKWMAETGGIDGKPIGLHVDVVSELDLMLRAMRWLQAVQLGQPIPYPVVTSAEPAEGEEDTPNRGKEELGWQFI